MVTLICVYLAFPEATIISSEKCRDLVIESGDVWVQMMENMVGRPFPVTKPVVRFVYFTWAKYRGTGTNYVSYESEKISGYT